MSTKLVGSILAVDFGNVHTRAVLIDLVEGTYKPVAYSEVRTTGGFPHGDVTIGMTRALRQISRASSRRLLSTDGRLIIPEEPDGSGVETLLVTTSIGRPLRTVLIGLTQDLSIASALRAIAGTYVQVVEVVSLEDNRDENEQLNAIAMSRPDLIFIVGGIEAGAKDTVLQLARRAALALRLNRDNRQRVVLFAGNSQIIPEIEELFQGLATVLIADNVRPALRREQVAEAAGKLSSAYDQVAGDRGAGFDEAARSSPLGILPTAQSYGLVTRYLGRTQGSALSLDVGSGVSTLSAAIGSRDTTTIRNDIGLGHSAPSLVETAGIDAVRRWLPFEVDDSEIRAYAMNKQLRPGTVPENERELYLEHALLRAGIGRLVQSARPLWTDNTRADPDAPLPPFKTIIGAGAVFSNTGRPGMSAMLMLDALQPTGVTKLLLDGNALIPALGALARVQQEAFVQLLSEGGIIPLGTCISADDAPRQGRTAFKIRITLPDGVVVRQDVNGGELWLYPLPLGVRAVVDVRGVRGTTIGGKRRVRMELLGGTAGIVFDTRGRPLPVALTAAGRAQQLPTWYSQATGDPPRLIEPEWLETVVKESEPVPDIREMIEQRERRPTLAAAPRATGPLAAPQNGADAEKGEKDDLDELRNLFS